MKALVLSMSLLVAAPTLHAEDGDRIAIKLDSNPNTDAIARGKYLYDAADCAGCHGGGPNGGAPAGGRALTTPFGVFYPPNISADPRFGIGGWSETEFREALRHGVAPGGKQLFPVFPFPSFSGLNDQDIGDIRAYILSLPMAAEPSKPHEIPLPFRWRPLMAAWRAMFFRPGPLLAVAGKNEEWNRGNYLVHAVAHCEECHTPRNPMGALRRDKSFSGNIGGPDGQNAPNITSDAESGIGSWTMEELVHFLGTGETPDFDSVASGMAGVIRGLKRLSESDRHAMAVYLKSVPAIHTVKPPPKTAN